MTDWRETLKVGDHGYGSTILSPGPISGALRVSDGSEICPLRVMTTELDRPHEIAVKTVGDLTDTCEYDLRPAPDGTIV